ncbi:tetratricopeptide repeat protein 33 [Bombina bombina]|uniref:tetratricopeptide repeat protein 33 n=1 Tax=Bombina bombina TaxID=8345 RepID=UPI00235A5014|nr:tetratricopeptide repeat protein 33 [Bombina bombina]XP_053557206.1 tetratricopeptide repeat protein 33 [Bombina bombina]
MASFGWKRKIGEKVSKATSQHFESEAAEEAAKIRKDVDWIQSVKRKKGILLESNLEKSKQLKEEGAILAQNGRHSEAVQKWDEAIQLTPEDATLYEMKAQALMCLHEIFPAVQAAEKAIQGNPHFVEAWQTLGRAQLGLGEITMAIRSFQVGLHICPDNTELWEQDLTWARSLLQQKKDVRAADDRESNSNKIDIAQELIPDYDFESDEVLAVCDAISQRQKTATTNKATVVSASGSVEQKEETATTADPQVFIKAR